MEDIQRLLCFYPLIRLFMASTCERWTDLKNVKYIRYISISMCQRGFLMTLGVQSGSVSFSSISAWRDSVSFSAISGWCDYMCCKDSTLFVISI